MKFIDINGSNGEPSADDKRLSVGNAFANLSFLPSFPNAAPAIIRNRLESRVYPEDFRVNGEVNRDSLLAFFAASKGKEGVLRDEYHINDEIYIGDLTDTMIRGEDGAKIVGSVGYGVLQAGHLANAVFENFSIESTYSNKDEDEGKSLFYSFRKNVKDTRFSRMGFSNKNSFTSALTIYLRTDPSDADSMMDGLWIENCDFTDVGRIGITLMNRGYEATDPDSAAQRVFIRQNRFVRCGAAAPAYAPQGAGLHGMAISFDGRGRQAEFSYNYLESLQGIGIENVSWNDLEISNNLSKDFRRGFQLISVNDAMGQRPMSRIVVRRNSMVGDASGAKHSAFMGMDRTCVVEENVFQGADTDHACLIRRPIDLFLRNNSFINRNRRLGKSALIVEDGNIRSENDFFDVSELSKESVAVRFIGGKSTGSVLSESFIKQGSADSVVDELSGAAGNIFLKYRTDADSVPCGFCTVVLEDADTIISGLPAIIAYDAIGFEGHLSSRRRIHFPKAKLRQSFWVQNNTNQDLVLCVDSVDGDTLSSGRGGTAIFNPITKSIYITRS